MKLLKLCFYDRSAERRSTTVKGFAVLRVEWDLRGSQREGDVSIRGQAKPKSSAVVLHTTSGLKMPAWSQHAVNAPEQDSPFIFLLKFDVCCSVAVSSYQFIQGEAQAAVFIQDEEAPLPFLTSRHSKQQNHYSSDKKPQQRNVKWVWMFHQDLPWTAASGCQNLSPPEPNTASLHRRVSPVIHGRNWVVKIQPLTSWSSGCDHRTDVKKQLVDSNRLIDQVAFSTKNAKHPVTQMWGFDAFFWSYLIVNQITLCFRQVDRRNY